MVSTRVFADEIWFALQDVEIAQIAIKFDVSLRGELFRLFRIFECRRCLEIGHLLDNSATLSGIKEIALSCPLQKALIIR